MKYILCVIVIVSCTLLAAENIIDLCPNGVFKCVSPNSLRICFYGQLVTSEFFCPNSTYCSESSSTICTNTSWDYDYYDYISSDQKSKPETNANFTCTESGLFPIPNSDCTKYYKCIPKGSEFLLKTLVCYKGLFDPVTKTCSQEFECIKDAPEGSSSTTDSTTTDLTTTDSTTTNSTTDWTTTDWTTIDSTTTDSISTLSTTTVSTIIDSTTTDSITTDSRTSDSTTTVSTITDSTTADSTTTDSTTTDSTTTDDATVSNTTPTEIESSSTEPVISDSTTNKDETETTIPADKTNTETSTISTTTALPECTVSGRFPLKNTNCSKYVSCSVASGGFLQKIYECLPNTYFDPETQRCSTYYICPDFEITTSTTESSIETTSSVSPTTSIPKCTKSGKFPLANTCCIQYLQCFLTTEGFLSKIYNCSTNTLFNPVTQRCSEFYECVGETNCPTTTTSTTPTTTTAEITTPTPTTTEITIPTTITTESSSIETSPTTSIPECTKSGKFPLTNTCCTQYLSCMLTTEGFLPKIYNCSTDTFFNPVSQTCSKSYVCGEDTNCPTTPTTTPTTTTEITTPTTTTTEITIPTTITTESSSIETSPTTSIPECTKSGKFPITNTCCTQYLSCMLTTEGFLSKIYNCSTDTFFNPVSQTCSKSYVCDEDTNCPTTPTTTPTTTTEITTPTTTSTEITIPTTTESPSTETSSSVSPTTPIPECTKSGKFPITNTCCTQYLSCSLTTDGFLSKIYNCSTDTLFNPVSQSCSKFYVCDEDINCPTTPITTTTEIPSPTTETTTITTSGPTCTSAGKFPVSNTNCSMYLLCVVSTQGFLQQIFPCPHNTFFDPAAQRCVTNYKCQETVSTEPSTTIKVSTTENPVGSCIQEGTYPLSNTNCTKYLMCVVTTAGFLEQAVDCPTGTSFDPELKKCSGAYMCPELQTTSNTIEETKPSTEQCTQAGKSVIANTGCKKYRSCLVSTTGFKSIEIECPSGTLFDSQLEACSSSYTCNENSNDVTNNTGCVRRRLNQCTEVGRFPIAGFGCKKFVLCSQTQTGFVGTEYECPVDTNFDPNNGRCSQNYKCAENDCLTTPGIKPTTELPNVEIPSCLIQGRQEIAGTQCKKFVLCTETAQGFVSAVYSCPVGTYFHPNLKRCSSAYICDENVKCTTVGQFPDPNDENCEYYYDCTENEINNIQGTRTKCDNGQFFNPEIQQCSAEYNCQKKTSLLQRAARQNVISSRNLVNGQCTTVGRYPVQLTNCKNYVYCSVNTDGTLRGTNFICPTTTVFNPAIQKCTTTSSYTCPDNFCVNNPGLIPWTNPNVRDCSSYIECQPVTDSMGQILGWSGVIIYCPQNTRYNPMLQMCDPFYVCPTNNG